MAITSVIISEQYYNEILTAIGYPLITGDDLELTEDQIKSLCLIPSLREYYRWSPIKVLSETSVSGNFSVDFPNSSTFDVLDARINTVGDLSSSYTGNPLVDTRNWSKSSRYGGNMYSTGNNYDIYSAKILENALASSYISKYKSIKITKDYENRKVTGYSNVSGRLCIVFCDYSSDFSDIPYQDLNDVLDYCKVKLLEVLIMIRGQSNQNLPQEFNTLFTDKYSELKDKILEKWRKRSKITILN